jgi:predicted ABC-type ATPase
MLAGPNGSGKSTILDMLRQRSAFWLGMYLNADDVERNLSRTGVHHFDDSPTMDDWQSAWRQFIEQSRPNNRFEPHARFLNSIRWASGAVQVNEGPESSYGPGIVVEFAREQCLRQGWPCAFETVMSHSSKPEFLHRASLTGARTYLYFVATESPDINIARVQLRQARGGHFVPDDKVRTRYTRSLDLLPTAIAVSDRAFLFDNSGDAPELVAESQNGRLEYRTSHVPRWLDRVV